LRDPERKIFPGNQSLQDFLESVESQESPRFPGKPRDSWLSWLFLMCKKAWKARNFSAEFQGFLGSFLQGFEILLSMALLA